MEIDKRNYSHMPDFLLSNMLFMDAGLARMVQKECEAKGMFRDISFLDARQQLITYSLYLDDDEETDDMLEGYFGRDGTSFADPLKEKIGDYLSQFSAQEREILMTASDEDDVRGSLAVRHLVIACQGYMAVDEKPVDNEPVENSLGSRVSSFFRRFYSGKIF